MEDLLVNQNTVIGAIEQLFRNFKKDSSERKTSDYIKRRLDTLDSYWVEFQSNHSKLLEYDDYSHAYFTGSIYEKTKDFYDNARAYIQKYNLGKLEPRPETPKTLLMAPPRFIPPQQTTSQGASSKTDEMLKKQASNFRAFMHTVSNINLDNIKEKWEFDDLLKILQSRWAAIDSQHWEIDSELEGQNETYEQSFAYHESKYNEIKKAVNSKLWSESHREKSTPQMDIPCFYGNFHKWVSFKDLFIEAIHRNPSISNAQKMQFLKGKVKGEAERLIQHLSISSDNYSVCWDILNHRYNNVRLIFRSHINLIMNIPVMHQQSLKSIKNLHDTARECLFAIKNLGVDISTWDPLLVHLISQKLDNDTYNDYNDSIKNPRELPVLKEFLEFLEGKFTNMESSRKKLENPTLSSRSNNSQLITKYSYQKNNNPKQSFSSSRVNNQHYENKKLNCPICNNNHGVFSCEKFLSMPNYLKLKTTAKLNLCENCLYSHKDKTCFSEKRCRDCNERHNTLLHNAFMQARNSTPSSVPSGSATTQPRHERGFTTGSNPDQFHSKSHVSLQTEIPEVLLATALIKVESADGSYHILRALLDQGSQASIVTEHAAQLLNLPRKAFKGVISGVGVKESQCKGTINIKCRSVISDYEFQVETLIMKNLITKLPSYTFSKPTWGYLDNIQLADPEFYKSRPVDVLLGADVYSLVLLEGIRRGGESLPLAQHTRLGWILSGNANTVQCNVIQNNIDEIRRFWEIEDITEDSTLTVQDLKCIELFKSTTIRRPDGRFEVRIPFKTDFEKYIGKSRAKALAQFIQLEQKFTRNETIAQDYKLFINEYLALGHMIPSAGNLTPECYLPHHCVHKTQSLTTKLRVVFNASAPTSSGYSLNDLMERGPNLQQDLQSLILRWRKFRYAYTADIEKMFRQIFLNKSDQHFHKIIWRQSPMHALKEYQLTTVTYGTKCAPFLAMMCLKQLANDEQKYPEVSQVLDQSFYMDDLIHGSHSIEAARSLQQQLKQLLNSAGFNLRKWTSNATELLTDTDASENYYFKGSEFTKILGVSWNPQQDLFCFQTPIGPSQKYTKRVLLSEISKLFDPLGWLAPVSTKMKILFQSVCLANIQWDDAVPNNICIEWQIIKDDIKNIDKLNVPRWLGTEQQDNIELYGFCDASTKAYACVIYSRVHKKHENKSIISLVVAKTKLVPANKTITVPKLELSGALLLSKLMAKVKQCISEYNISNIYGWTDSTVVLGWLNGDPDKYKPFVSSRIKQITTNMPKDCWHYVKSEENPADCASRGLTATQLKDHGLWWNGPSWLPNLKNIPVKQVYTADEESKKRHQANSVQHEQNIIIMKLLTDYSTITRAIRILAWILRFISKNIPKRSYLTLQEINNSRLKIIKYIQEIEFQADISRLKSRGDVSNKSRILNLNPYIDGDSVLRVGGRLRNAHIDNNMKHPIILPHCSRLTDLIIDQAHKLTFHGGPQLTLALIRQRYWIIGGIRAVKKRLHFCVTCRKNNPRLQHQIMGDLPEARCNPARPFYHTGVDYTGFIMLRANKGRGTKCSKGYIAVFVCMASKAVHLEVVSDLTTSSFLSALKRMAARRGTPGHIYSDNGTNFLGANKILQSEYEQLRSIFNEDFMNEITNMQITWHFNAPAWPSAGGLWEAAVKSLKNHLKRVIGEQRLTYEELSTLLSQLEACLNSRPLCPMSEDPDDLDCLTPAHFLTGGPTLTVINTESDLRTRWHLTQKLFNDVWKRWRLEYLSQITTRSKWKKSNSSIQINDLVLIHDSNLPAGKWAIGRVIELHPGKDGFVRVVTLKTRNGILKRPIVKLSVLPIQNSEGSNSHEHQDTSNKSKTRKCLSSLVLLLLYFMSIIMTSQCSFNVTKFREKQGLYFDKLTNMHLVRDYWKLILYYDMDPYWQGVKAYNQYVEHLDYMCNNIRSQTHCDVILMQLRHGQSELDYYDRLLLTQHWNNRVRRRRGLINGVGYIANSLFGVLDERFAEQYQRDIESLKHNQNHLRQLWRNQTSVIEAEYNLLKRSEEAINKQSKIINKQFLNLDKVVNTLGNQVNSLSNISEFSLAAITANNMLHTLQGIQELLLDTVTDIYHGRFNFHLLTPEQLRNQLSIISSQISKDLSLPIKNIQMDIRSIYNFLKVKTRMLREYLLFEITIPLTSRDSYEIYHIIPIPERTSREGEGTMITIEPISEHIAINLAKDSFIKLSRNDLTLCARDLDTYLCYLQRPIFDMQSDTNLCEIDIVTNQCKFRVETCQDTWHELNDINKYIYYCCSECYFKIICEHQMTASRISAGGIISIAPGCIVKFNKFTVYAHNQGHNSLQIKPSIDIPNNNIINNIINMSSLWDAATRNTSYDENWKDQMRALGEKINEMKQEPGLEEYSLSYHDIHHYTLIYIMGSVVVIAGAVMAWRRGRRGRRAGLDRAGGDQRVTDTGRYHGTSSDSVSESGSVVQCSAINAIPKSDRATSPIARAPTFNVHENIV